MKQCITFLVDKNTYLPQETAYIFYGKMADEVRQPLNEYPWENDKCHFMSGFLEYI